MISLGLILLLIGFVTGVAIVWTVGVIVLIIAVVLGLLGVMGRAMGGRWYYFCALTWAASLINTFAKSPAPC
jgi:hypothetical protein